MLNFFGRDLNLVIRCLRNHIETQTFCVGNSRKQSKWKTAETIEHNEERETGRGCHLLNRPEELELGPACSKRFTLHVKLSSEFLKPGENKLSSFRTYLHSVISKIQHPKSYDEDNSCSCPSTFECAACV